MGVGVTAYAELNLCDTPLSAVLSIDTVPSVGGMDFAFSASHKLRIPIPFLTFPIPLVTAGGFAVGAVSGSLKSIQLALGLDACGKLVAGV